MNNDYPAGVGGRIQFAAILLESLLAKGDLQGLALICANIDNMKHFNQHNGHQKGDALIWHLASVIQNATGGRGQVFRVAGDEFMTIMSCCDESDAVSVSQKIVSRFTDTPLVEQLEHCGDKQCLGPAAVSVSVGLVVANAGNCPSADELTEQAIGKMMNAKESGRNCARW